MRDNGWQIGRSKMKDYQEVYIKTGAIADEEVIDHIIEFAKETDGWIYPEKESMRYATAAGAPACAIAYAAYNPPVLPGVAVVKKKEGLFYVPNIVPKRSSRLSMMQYNEVAVAFGRGLRSYFKRHKVPVSVSLPSTEVHFEDIVKSKKARSYFQLYLQNYPLSYHSLDIERLDRFTCALARYSRQAIDFDAFEQYLIEVLSWAQKDARWCRKRVEIGWEVLMVKGSF
jgi:hypothetical protein